MSFRCRTCGKTHDELPRLGLDQPDQWFDMAPAQRDARGELTSDTCVIDGEHFFIRGVIEIPVHGEATPFGFTVWVSQKKENFETYVRHFESADIGPFFGWLSNRISFYPDTLLLKTMAHFHGGGLRPTIHLDPTDHPLAVDQREGISLERAWQIVHHYDPGTS